MIFRMGERKHMDEYLQPRASSVKEELVDEGRFDVEFVMLHGM